MSDELRAREDEALKWLVNYDPGDGFGPIGRLAQSETAPFTRSVVIAAYTAGMAAAEEVATARPTRGTITNKGSQPLTIGDVTIEPGQTVQVDILSDGRAVRSESRGPRWPVDPMCPPAAHPDVNGAGVRVAMESASPSAEAWGCLAPAELSPAVAEDGRLPEDELADIANVIRDGDLGEVLALADQCDALAERLTVARATPIGTPVRKRGGDYEFDGTIRAVVFKRSGEVRYVVEDERGLLLTMNGRQCGIGESPGEFVDRCVADPASVVNGTHDIPEADAAFFAGAQLTAKPDGRHFELRTPDPRFTPGEPITVNGYVYVPRLRGKAKEA